MRWKPDIFEFLDYRAFLGAYYEAAKANQPQFSYRYFSRRAGFASSNFLKLVIERQRNLSQDSVDKIAGALSLSADEHRFFSLLVTLDQDPSHEARHQALEQITAMRRFLDAKPIDSLLFEYLTHWYYVAIRELAARADFQADAAWIAQRICPKITQAQAQQALDTLLRLGLLTLRDDGSVDRGEPTLDAGHEVSMVGAKSFHHQMLQQASWALDHLPSPARDFGAMTVCVPADALPALKSRIQQFREQLISFCDELDASTTVYQINIQLFPLSTPEEP